MPSPDGWPRPSPGLLSATPSPPTTHKRTSRGARGPAPYLPQPEDGASLVNGQTEDDMNARAPIYAGRRWTIASARECRARRVAGERLKDIAAEWGITSNALGERMRTAGMEPVPRKRTGQEGHRRLVKIRRGAHLRSVGMSWKEAAEAVGWETDHWDLGRSFGYAVRKWQRGQVEKEVT